MTVVTIMSVWVVIFWLRLSVITGVVRVVSDGVSFDGNVSSPGFVLSSIHNLFLVSIGSLIGDDGHLSVLSSGHWSVFGFLDDVVPGLRFSPVLRLLLSSVFGIEDSAVSGFFLLLVLDFILVGEPCLLFLVVLGDRVSSILVVDLMSVSVLLFLSVKDLVACLIDLIWNISVVSLGVGVIDDPWHELILGPRVLVILDLVVGRESLFFVCVVLCLRLNVGVVDRDLSRSDLVVSLGADGVLDLIVVDFDVSEFISFAVFGMSVLVFFVVVVRSDLDGSSSGGNKC